MTTVDVRRRRNPVRLFFSAEPWASTLYLASYLVVGTALFGIVLTVVLTSSVLSIIWIGLPLLVGAAVIVRGCAGIERWRAGLVADLIPGRYRPVRGSGIYAQVKTRWSDPATLRDCGYLVLMYVPLLVLDAVVLAVWLALVGMATVPLWFWSIPLGRRGVVVPHGVMIGYLPNLPAGPHMAFGGADGFGVWIGDLPSALIAALVFFILALLAGYVVVGAARLHATAARSLLGPYVDPLVAAKQVLAQPGPLTGEANRG